MANAMQVPTFESNGHARRLRVYQEPEVVGGVEKSFGEFCACVMKARGSRFSPRSRDEACERLEKVYRATPVEKTLMSEASGQVGGYLVPQEWRYGMMRDVAENSFIWPRAFVQPMASKTLMLPFPTPLTSQGVQKASNMFGGMVLQWKGTANAVETEPSFGQVELIAKDLDGYQLASNQLAEDFQGLGAFLYQLITRAVGWFTEQAFLMGTGGAGSEFQPYGVVNSPGTITVTRNTTATIVQADVAAMYSQLLPGSIPRAIWAISPTAIAKLANLTGLGGILYFLPGSDGSQGLLYGIPFYVTEKLPDVGTKGDIVLFDPTLYCIGDRYLAIDYSDQEPTAFPKGQSVWRVVWRGDGTPLLSSSVTLANQSNTKAAMAVVLSTL